MKSFGEVLRFERERSGLSQEELGQLINAVKSTISQYELGKRKPDIDTLQQFANIFNCCVDYLLGRTDKRDSYSQNADDDIQPTPPERYRTFQKKIGELSPESLTFLEFQLDRLRELDLEAVERRRAERDALQIKNERVKK